MNFCTGVAKIFQAIALAIVLLSLSAVLTEAKAKHSLHRPQRTSNQTAAAKPGNRKRSHGTRVASSPAPRTAGRRKRGSVSVAKAPLNSRHKAGSVAKAQAQKATAKKADVIEPAAAVGKDRIEADNVKTVLSRAYHLYDQGLNSRLNGSSTTAVKQLDESRRLFEDARRYQSRGVPSTAEFLADFEMGRAAEAAGDFSTARDSYSRCLKLKPDFIGASSRLVTLLARNKQLPLAMVWARQAAQKDPLEPRAHTLLALVLSKVGESEKALVERRKAESLLSGQVVQDPNPVDVAVPYPQPEQQPPTTAPTDKSADTPVNDERNNVLKRMSAARDKLMTSLPSQASGVRGVAIGPGTLRVFVERVEDFEKLPAAIDGVPLECVLVTDK